MVVVVVVSKEDEWRAGRREETGSDFLERCNFNRDKRPAAPLTGCLIGMPTSPPAALLGRSDRHGRP